MTIVAAIDASPAAPRVLERAVGHVRKSGDELHVVHVFQPPATVYPMQGMYLIDDEELEAAEQELAWKNASRQLEDAGITWKRVDLRGYPSSSIVAYAGEVGAEMIVVGTRGRGGFASLVLGSTSQAVIHDANCDVLIVKIPPAPG